MISVRYCFSEGTKGLALCALPETSLIIAIGGID